ncbi:NADP-dependent oxidoreductase [Novosphingobium sp. MMS21-SN21R]|uniref:NADP-dependent oxidoreductase n=1 Tax=Novosphingobium sp. MMS21-SN21R TaxID=2969298 RepID=UPI0028841A2A|nr:NADP-dependent oxidoreductase [Novosphingobium sp. MMS21-SN21R]MDT0509622.1 NADP-dependent oxidoreductase [Novosphingobium sp. MMS21-SN21R]
MKPDAINARVLLVNRPAGVAQASDFAIAHAAVPEPAPGEILVRNHYLSVDPAMRGWIADVGNYSAPVAIGDVMRSLCSGEIVASRNPDYAVGEFVTGWFGWQDYAAVSADRIVQRTSPAEAKMALGILGLNGTTALLALTTIGEPKPGQTVVVSTAAGAVGSAVGQIARIHGCRTIGITSSPAKVRDCVDLFGYDAAIDYRTEDVGARVAALCPGGVDIYFDNTAGTISDAVMRHLAQKARVVVCGTASYDRWVPWPDGPRVERHLLVKRARMEGFVLFDHMDRLDEAVGTLRGWIADGRLTYQEDLLTGIEACPDALAGLYRGENRGKRIVQLV